MLIESTQNCGQTPLLLFLLEELGAPYELELRPDGYFLETYGRPGPKLVDEDLTLFEGLAMLRHCARTRAEGRLVPESPTELARLDAWLDLVGRLGMTFVALLREEREQGDARRPARIAEERARLMAMLRAIEQALEDSDGDWLLGDFSLADCAMASLPRLLRMPGLDLADWPRLRAYGERLALRPAASRVRERLALPQVTRMSPELVLEFWFGTPPTSETELMDKARRWFAGGAAMDAEVKSRFGGTVEDALAGKLDDWAATPRGRLALVIVLDQLTRNALRGDARAFSGDRMAQKLAIEAFDGGAAQTLSLVEQVFLSMPLLHAEDPQVLARAAEIAERLAVGALAPYAKLCAMHTEQSRKYLAVVTRFGRFPHRNRVLGRVSTAEEESFLSDWAEKQPPAGAHAR